MNAHTEPNRHCATSADGLARAVVDGTGRIVDLAVSEDLLRRPPWTVAATVLEAVRSAQDNATTAYDPDASPTAGDTGATLDVSWLTAATESAGIEADRRVAQLATTIDNLVRAWERR